MLPFTSNYDQKKIFIGHTPWMLPALYFKLRYMYYLCLYIFIYICLSLYIVVYSTCTYYTLCQMESSKHFTRAVARGLHSAVVLSMQCNTTMLKAKSSSIIGPAHFFSSFSPHFIPIYFNRPALYSLPTAIQYELCNTKHAYILE